MSAYYKRAEPGWKVVIWRDDGKINYEPIVAWEFTTHGNSPVPAKLFTPLWLNAHIKDWGTRDPQGQYRSADGTPRADEEALIKGFIAEAEAYKLQEAKDREAWEREEL